MGKKVTKTTGASLQQTGSGAAPAKASASASRPKHIKAQAVAVAAAVEGFVQSLGTSTVHHVEKTAEIEPDQIAGVAKEEAPLKEPSPSTGQMTHAEISALAYRFYLERGGHNGSQADDWFRAEEALRSGRE